MTWARLTLVTALACACANREPRTGSPDTVRPDQAPRSARTLDAAPGPDAAVANACAMEAAALAGMVGRARVAMDPKRSLEKAKAGWAATPDGCHDGAWHLAAAHLLREGVRGPLTAGDVHFATADEALAAGLTRDPDAPELLVFVAFLSAFPSNAGPPLPVDACERVERAPDTDDRAYVNADRRRYVCGHAALRDGRFADAARLLGEVEDPGAYPDVPLRRAQALIALGKAADAKRDLAEAASLSEATAMAFGATSAEAKALIAEAKEAESR